MPTPIRRACTLALVAAATLMSGCIAVDKTMPPDHAGAHAPEPPRAQMVAFDSNPRRAEVWVDGNFVGTTPLRYPLEPGDHRVELRAPGYQSWARTLHVVAGSDSNVSVNLVATTE